MRLKGSSTTARVHMHANNACSDSKVGNSKRSYRSYFEFGISFLPIHCSLINGEKSQFRGTFLRSSENSRFAYDWETTKLQENMFSCHTVNRIIIGKICTLDTGIVTHLLISCLSFEIMNESL